MRVDESKGKVRQGKREWKEDDERKWDEGRRWREEGGERPDESKKRGMGESGVNEWMMNGVE